MAAVSCLRYVESDGRGIANAKDPPGQRSIYIQPGEPEKESYRLVTFNKYPRHVPVKTRQLAKFGFYYTGFKDRVKCFSCGHCVDDWTLGDQTNDPRWHSVNCNFVKGTDTTNIPMFSGCFSQNLRFATNFCLTQTPSTSRTGGDVLMNTELRVNESSSNVNLLQSGATFHPNQVIQSSPPTLPSDSLFPCNNPVNPHMRSTELRLQTFTDSNQWPSDRISATPKQIAEAGLFYLGSRDRVKCWYCNGGLQNWETSDDPWFEHAKWFPECEFVLKSKGLQFVENVVAQYPNIQRPTPFVQSTNHQRDMPSSSQQPQIIDPQQELNKQTKVVEEAMQTSELVSSAKLMGFSDIKIKSVLIKEYQQHSRLFSDVTSLVNALIQSENSARPSEDVNSQMESQSPEIPPKNKASIGAAGNLTDDIRNLEAQKLCKNCNIRMANVVLLPCGHLACCAECSGRVHNCPVCKTKISEIINCYLV